MDVYDNAGDAQGAPIRSRPGQGPNEKVYDRIVDEDGRVVSLKPANRGMLAARAKRKAYSKGSSWSPVVLLFIFLPLLSSFLTNTYTFGLNVARVQKIVTNPFRPQLKTFSPQALKRFDGSDPWLPVYVGIMGEVYDVSKNRRIYGKGGSYNMMAGRDASRSFATGCFQTHLTHDLRGLTADQLKGLEGWRSFFAKHDHYRLVGHVVNPDIDPASPIPPPCDEEAADAEVGAARRGT